MEATRSEWSDRRLDDLKGEVIEVKRGVERVDGRIDALQRTMVHGFFALATMFVTGFGIIVTLIFTTHG
jgi:hypothetical protein